MLAGPHLQLGIVVGDYNDSASYASSVTVKFRVDKSPPVETVPINLGGALMLRATNDTEPKLIPLLKSIQDGNQLEALSRRFTGSEIWKNPGRCADAATVRNGCTPAEAAAAQRKLDDLLIYVRVGYMPAEAKSGVNFAELQKRPKPWAKLSRLERERIEKIEQQEDAKDRHARKRRENLVLARTILTNELWRRHPHIKREAAEKLVKDAVEKLVSGQH